MLSEHGLALFFFLVELIRDSIDGIIRDPFAIELLMHHYYETIGDKQDHVIPSLANPGFYPDFLGLIDALLQSLALARTFWLAWTTAYGAVGGIFSIHYGGGMRYPRARSNQRSLSRMVWSDVLDVFGSPSDGFWIDDGMVG